jgi:hypothetical protein
MSDGLIGYDRMAFFTGNGGMLSKQRISALAVVESPGRFPPGWIMAF